MFKVVARTNRIKLVYARIQLIYCASFNYTFIFVDTDLQFFKKFFFSSPKSSTAFEFFRNFAFSNITPLTTTLLPVLRYNPLYITCNLPFFRNQYWFYIVINFIPQIQKLSKAIRIVHKSSNENKHYRTVLITKEVNHLSSSFVMSRKTPIACSCCLLAHHRH